MAATRGKDVPIIEFRNAFKKNMELLEIGDSFSGRYINEGFSGGEKKRHEILQLSLLDPVLAILDEADSGLDIDALKVVSAGIERYRSAEHSVLLITHYQRILDHVTPDVVHVFANGRVIKSGDKSLAKELESKGYDWVLKETAGAK
jgi:Fe-S cluster assembly ATP-binding protein